MVCFHLGTNYIVVSDDWSRRQSTMIRIYRGTSRNLSTDVYCFVKSSFQIDSATAQWLYLLREIFQIVFSKWRKRIKLAKAWLVSRWASDLRQITEVLCSFTRHKMYFRSEPTLQTYRISNVLGSRFFREFLYTCNFLQASPETSNLKKGLLYHLAGLLVNSPYIIQVF